MKQTLTALLAALTLTACATITAETDQAISVTTEPAGAKCALQNSVGNWSIDKTPGTATVDRSFSPLVILCSDAAGNKGTATLEPKTRGRAYGNILMLGVPAVVDASTGAGYEYAPDSVSIALGK